MKTKAQVLNEIRKRKKISYKSIAERLDITISIVKGVFNDNSKYIPIVREHWEKQIIEILGVNPEIVEFQRLEVTDVKPKFKKGFTKVKPALDALIKELY